MTEPAIDADLETKAKILAILEENRIMSIATARSDGWPHVTMVGFVHDDLALYFVVARDSQKFTNIARDPRVSIAVGHDQSAHIRGLSIAARAAEVLDIQEVLRLNASVRERYPEHAVFAPREALSAVMRATPSLISVIDMSKGPGHPELVTVSNQTSVTRVADPLS
ncbi:pyridoxamine 5'-phosphate oxidase family protein [soil metagenome]